MIVDLLIITTLVCFVVNSGAVDSLKRMLWRWLKGDVPYRDFPLKPLDCELCLTWWSGVCYIIIADGTSLIGFLWVALCAWMTPLIVDILHLSVELPRWGLDKLRRWLGL